MKYYSECLFCHAPLGKVANVRNAFCDAICKNGYRDWKRERGYNKRATKQFNPNAVNPYVQLPLFTTEEQ